MNRYMSDINQFITSQIRGIVPSFDDIKSQIGLSETIEKAKLQAQENARQQAEQQKQATSGKNYPQNNSTNDYFSTSSGNDTWGNGNNNVNTNSNNTEQPRPFFRRRLF
jgi:hypothetical protein